MAAANGLHDRITRYIDDAIAVEQGIVTGLKDMITDATDPIDVALFQEHLAVMETQRCRLEQRLEALSRHPNSLKHAVNKLGITTTSLRHAGKDAGDKATRNLVQAHAIENIEIAMYDSLIAAATAAGYSETVTLARTIQAEEEATAKRIFPRIAPMAKAAVEAAV